MKKGKLIVQPMGGLANRIRVIAYCYQLVIGCNAEMVCLWTVNNELYAPFDTLFKAPPFSIKNVHGKQWLQVDQKKWYKRLISRIFAIFRRIDMLLSYNRVEEALKGGAENERVALSEKIRMALGQGKIVYIATGAWLGTVTNISFISPVNSIMERVEKNLATFDVGHSYGFHIRRTDNAWAIEHSPIELFEKKIEEILTKDGSAKFYLATDDVDTAKYLCDKYGKCIIYREKELSRTSVIGICEAVTDMWILGNMDVIYGSYWSSFSEVASWINNKPMEALSLHTHKS